MTRHFLARIIGDGKSRATAFRADIPVLPGGVAGAAPIPCDAEAKPLHSDVIVELRRGGDELLALLEAGRSGTALGIVPLSPAAAFAEARQRGVRFQELEDKFGDH